MMLRENTKKEPTNKTEPKSARLMSNFCNPAELKWYYFPKQVRGNYKF